MAPSRKKEGLRRCPRCKETHVTTTKRYDAICKSCKINPEHKQKKSLFLKSLKLPEKEKEIIKNSSDTFGSHNWIQKKYGRELEVLDKLSEITTIK